MLDDVVLKAMVIGAPVEAEAGARAAAQWGAKWIRIDTWTTNTGLHDYYMKRGFEPCGFCADSNYPSGALFQKSVSTAGGTTTTTRVPGPDVPILNHLLDLEHRTIAAYTAGGLRSAKSLRSASA